ncbi:MAG TPA: sigma-70 family RNA polymerase sigma factor [Actinomycetes bacterium]|nr:sigma-70 family RNA polymerase sigma factor [Actinomycetes bacterium]
MRILLLAIAVHSSMRHPSGAERRYVAGAQTQERPDTVVFVVDDVNPREHPKREWGVSFAGESFDADRVSVDELSSDTPLRRRDAEPFESFYRREYPRIAALARVLTGPIGAEDHAQEAMLVAYRRWREVGQMADPAMWVRRVCANIATSQLRRRAAEARALLRLRGRRDVPTLLEPTDEDFWSAVRGLPRRQAQVVALHYIYDLSVADVAATLEMGEGTAKTHLSRARASLAKVLGEREEQS